MKQTAVEWLFEQVWITSGEDLPELLEQAKEMEKQQKGYIEEDMKNAFFEGWIARDGDLPFTKAKNKWFKEFKKEII